MHACPNCDQITDGTYDEDGFRWDSCEDCLLEFHYETELDYADSMEQTLDINEAVIPMKDYQICRLQSEARRSKGIFALFHSTSITIFPLPD